MSCGLREWLHRLLADRKLTPEMEANRCAISARDCGDAKAYLDAYLELKRDDDGSGTSKFSTHQEGLLIAAIVSYSRAFTESRHVQFAAQQMKVNLGSVFKNDASTIELHKNVLKTRNQAVAHSDWIVRNTELLEATKNGEVLRAYSVVDYSKGIDTAAFRSMAETMQNHFRNQAFDRDVTGANS